MTFNFLGPGLTVNVEAKVKEQIILDSSDLWWIIWTLINFRRFMKRSIRKKRTGYAISWSSRFQYQDDKAEALSPRQI